MVVKPEDPLTLNIMEKKRKKSFGGGGGSGGEMTLNRVVKAGKVIKLTQGSLPLKMKKGGGGGSSSGTLGNPSGSSLIEGMSTAEITMIRRLAGNDPNVRKKTMRKLRKWLSTLVLRFPEDLDSRSEVEPNIIRVWKALFYCMWMADKPLPQEQLAEQISNLVPIVGIKPNILVIFVEWFFRTMAREWNWIDRFRLDKFMMLFRRFLRKTLLTMASRKWSVDLVNGFLSTMRVYVFNHHPEIKFKKGEPPAEQIAQCPMGLQLHFIDIFLEELAKAGADGLKPSKVLKFLSPFIEEMASNSDDRVLDALTERIFFHLMKQSDVGIDYQEGLIGIDEDDSEEDFDGNEEDDDDEEEISEDEDGNDDGDNVMGEDEVFSADPGPMDPRAGAVDVVLPQLQLDYSILAEKLTEAGGSKLVKKRNRGKLYSLASSFKDLVQGNYPLALPEEGSSWKPAIPKQELDRATKRLLELEMNESTEVKVRRTKKQRKRDAKKLAQHEQLDDTAGSEDSSVYLNDSDFVDRVDDNYESYVDEQMDKSPGYKDKSSPDAADSTGPPSNKKKLKKRKKGAQLENSDEDDSFLEQNDSDEDMPKLKKKKKYKTIVEFEADELNGFIGDELQEDEELSVSVDQSPPKSKKQRLSLTHNTHDQDTVVNIQLPKKKRKSLTLGSGKVLTSIGGGQDLMQISKRKYKSLSPNSTSLGRALNGKSIAADEGTRPPFLTPVKHTDLLRKKLKMGGARASEGNSRRINFVLTNNLEHDATDYMPSISKSPAIPFDASKTPTSGILKSKLVRGAGVGGTPLGRKSVGGMKTSPRKKALDFF